ncbi:uncharacterized protein LOC143237882 isoform X2 [Tachypleus tridentatus]|uniref:uncharacterized protein LOC143237882 isoform X2 n=1 Tax=Tachypleus tridentatus TaxID=6853 RepID=UPI003FD4A9CD
MSVLTIQVCVFVLSLWTRVVIAKNSNFYQLRILHSNKHTTFQPENTFVPTSTLNPLNNHRKNTYRTVEETTLSVTPMLDKLQKYVVGNKLAIFNKKCQEHEQCVWMEDKGSSLQCLSGLCSCPSGYVFVKWPYNKVGCYRKGRKSPSERNIYLAVMIVISCIMFVVLVVIVTAVKRRVICQRINGSEQNNEGPNSTLSTNNQLGSVLSVDKPPTYEEVMDREREMFRIPPPKYSEIEIIRPFVMPSRLSSSLDNLRSPTYVTETITITTEADDSIATASIQDNSLDITSHEKHLATYCSVLSPTSTLSQESETPYQIYSNPTPTIISDANDVTAESELDATPLPSTSSKGYYDNPTFYTE